MNRYPHHFLENVTYDWGCYFQHCYDKFLTLDGLLDHLVHLHPIPLSAQSINSNFPPKKSRNEVSHTQYSREFNRFYDSPESSRSPPITNDQLSTNFEIPSIYQQSFSEITAKLRKSIKPHDPQVPQVQAKSKSDSGGLNFSKLPKRRPDKRNRTTFTIYQTDTMENEFRRNPYPKESTIQNLILMTGISADKIRVWFKNRRAKTQKGRMKNL